MLKDDGDQRMDFFFWSLRKRIVRRGKSTTIAAASEERKKWFSSGIDAIDKADGRDPCLDVRTDGSSREKIHAHREKPARVIHAVRPPPSRSSPENSSRANQMNRMAGRGEEFLRGARWSPGQKAWV